MSLSAIRDANYQAASAGQLAALFGEPIDSHAGCFDSSLTRNSNQRDAEGCVCCFSADVRAQPGPGDDCAYEVSTVYIFALASDGAESSRLVRDLVEAWQPQPSRASLVSDEESDGVETRLWRSPSDAFEARVTSTKRADGRVLIYGVFNHYPLE